MPSRFTQKDRWIMIKIKNLQVLATKMLMISRKMSTLIMKKKNSSLRKLISCLRGILYNYFSYKLSEVWINALQCSRFGKKMPWLCPSWVKFLILNVVLRVSRRKKPIFFCGAFLSCVVDEMFIDVPWFRENSPALKNSWLRTCYGYL